MSNKAHPECTIRKMASEARKRLQNNDYDQNYAGLVPPKDATISQKSVYIKLREMLESGEEILNPIQQLADQKLLDSLPHEERQRYILRLSSDYAEMKKALARQLAASDRASRHDA